MAGADPYLTTCAEDTLAYLPAKKAANRGLRRPRRDAQYL